MTTNVGLWIDHRQAIVVSITEAGETTEQILSHAEQQPRRAGDSPLKGAYESQQVPADDSRQRTFASELNTYYAAVIARIRAANAILIFGPGEAKHELNARLDADRLGGRVVGIVTVDKLTEHQIVAKVRDHFVRHHVAS
jgi:hypothetical protein